MHGVYYKKQNVVLLDYKITTVQTPKITAYVESDHCFTAQSGSPFWSRHV